METSSPLVSVIIPVFNREKFIAETIDSVLEQTYRNVAVLAVDDGSTDESRKILEGYGARIRILEHPDRLNKGQSAAINLAMRVAKGDYVAILDSDDLWAPGKIEKQANFLEKHPEYGLVYGNGFAIDERGKILYRIFTEDRVEESDPVRMLLECHFNIPSNALVRRSVFDKVGEFDETMRSAQDHDMGIRLLEVCKAAYLNEILWYYRIHPDTQSRKNTRRRWETGFRILEKACERYDYGWDVKRRRLAVLHFRLGQCSADEGSYFNALKKFLLAGLYDPVRAIRVATGREKTAWR